MLSALIDNSTLTAVQRVIGDVPVAVSFPIEGDLAAYDQYLQSLLLYDEVAAVDDYKEEHRLQRRGRFDEVRFLDPVNVPYSTANAYAEEAISTVAFEMERGAIKRGPLRDLLEALKLHVSPAWYMASSEWMLQMRLLADEADVDMPKYGSLMSAIMDQARQSNVSENEVHRNLRIEDREGSIIDPSKKRDGGIDNDVRAFATSLNWLSYRSVFYLALSSQMDSAFTLHPIRHQYLAQYILQHVGRDIPPDIRREMLNFFEGKAAPIMANSDRLLGFGAVGTAMPFFAAWAVGRAGNPRAGYDHVLHVRHSEPARTFRSHFRELEALRSSTDKTNARRSASRLKAAISEDLGKLATQFEGSKPNPGIGLSVNALSLAPSISLPNIVDRAKDLVNRRDRRAITILRDITSDMAAASTYGELSDRFTRSRIYRKGTGYVSDRTRVEPKRYRLSSTWFKKPL